MRLPFLFLLFILGLSIAGLVLWSLDAPPGGYVSVATPAVHQYQLAIVVTGPAPHLVLDVWSYNIARSTMSLLARISAPLWVMMLTLCTVTGVMLADTVRGTRKPARPS